MLAATDEPYYVIPSSESSAYEVFGERRSNEQKWTSGYRVEGIYSLCNGMNDIRVRWTSFPTFSLSDDVTGSSLWGTLLPADNYFNYQEGVASIRDELKFYYLDALAGQTVASCDRFQLDLHAGVQYLRLDFDEDVHYLSTYNNLPISFRSQLKGIGPEIGGEFLYCLTSCLSFTGRAYTALLASEQKSSFLNIGEGTTTEYDTSNEKYWKIKSFTDLRFGLSFNKVIDTACFSRLCGCGSKCFGFDAEVGYEFMILRKGLNRTRYLDDVTVGASWDTDMDFMLHGPYVHVGLTF